VKLATIRTETGTQAALIDGASALPLEFANVGMWLQADSPDPLQHVAGDAVALQGISWAPVVPRPGKIICVGLNYRDHILEMGRELPEYPTLFAKFAEALVGADEEVTLPGGSEKVDWEAELALVIGRRARKADAQEAAAAIAGFSVANDVSARDFQRRTTQWLQGKTFDATTPLGPFLVTTDESGPNPDLELRCSVNGVVKQKAGTGDLVFNPVDLVSYISSITTLNPGDVILTGTPGGVGDGMDPKEYLKAGDILETRIDGLGTAANTCVAG
jgi:acylpyruvate hydrolase